MITKSKINTVECVARHTGTTKASFLFFIISLFISFSCVCDIIFPDIERPFSAQIMMNKFI